MGYLLKHWRGEHSLARSFWFNFLILGFLLDKIFQSVLEDMESLGVFAFVFAGFLLFWIWQLVGTWRAAVRYDKLCVGERSRHGYKATLAKSIVLLVSGLWVFTLMLSLFVF